MARTGTVRSTVLFAAFVLAALVLYALFCQAYYDDWTCVIGDCVRVKRY